VRSLSVTFLFFFFIVYRRIQAQHCAYAVVHQQSP